MAGQALRSGLSMLLLAVWFGLCQANAGTPGGDFVLTDQTGQRFSLTQLRGKLVLLFFGYTYCPDICPTELSGVVSVLDALGDEADGVQGLFISLDPARDSPQVLRDYTRFFNEALIGLTGTQAEVDLVARQYQVRYRRHALASGGYTLDHSANLYVIDRQGALAAVVPYGLPPAHLLRLVRGLLGHTD